MDDTAVGAGAGHGGEIDAERPRSLAHGWCRQWPRSRLLRTWCGDPVDRCDGRRRRVRPSRWRAPDRRDGLRLVRFGGSAGCLGARFLGCHGFLSCLPCVGAWAGTVDIDPHQRRADRDDLTDLRTEAGDRAGDGRRQLDGRLVGHHVDDGLVLADDVADGHLPLDDLGLRHPFADVGQLEREVRHRTS